MAVVQISRIQVRRGQKNQGSGLPQLASGELGWAIDTRELYIGNGAVSEGAPAVGNTKVLTEYDDIFNLVDTYSYRANDTYIQTGSTSTNPTKRTLQDRLDDRVNGASFGLTGEVTQNATAFLQRALDQLYLNASTKGSEASRVVLNLLPGIYVVDSTIRIPPNCAIVGAGQGKTVIRTNTDITSLFKSVNEESSPGDYSDGSDTTSTNQGRNIHIQGLTLETTVANNVLLHLDTVRDSKFIDVEFKGEWESGDAFTTDYAGVQIDMRVGAITSDNNTFQDCTFTGLSYGVVSDWDLKFNVFDNCKFSTLGYGVAFGTDTIIDSQASSGKTTGPRDNIISNSIFSDINRQAILIEEGVRNTSKGNKFVDVGNEGGVEGTDSEYSVIKFDRLGNQSTNDFFSRTAVLSYDQSFINNYPYIPEIEGFNSSELGFDSTMEINQGTTDKLFRLPGYSNAGYHIDYVITSKTNLATRTGTMDISVNASGNTVEISDDYTFSGNSADDEKLYFEARIVDEDGDLTNDTICVKSINNTSGDTSVMQFKVKIKNTNRS